MFPNRPPFFLEEKAKSKTGREVFSRLCDQIFQRVYPELVAEHYNWHIYIEPDRSQIPDNSY